MGSFGELAGDMLVSVMNKLSNPAYEIYTIEEIRDAIEQITYDRDDLADERGSDYSGVKAMDIIIAELKHELKRRQK